jgi:adenylosuccinate lyase
MHRIIRLFPVSASVSVSIPRPEPRSSASFPVVSCAPPPPRALAAARFRSTAADAPLDAAEMQYDNPLVGRYASAEMSAVWSPQTKFRTWRRLWVALARAQQELGLAISDAQLAELEAHVELVDLERAAQYEKRFRHDVMAHVHAYGDQCPAAAPIIHLGATSCYVGDNTDLIQIRSALLLTRRRLVQVVARLRDVAMRYKDVPTLGFTHFQPAQLTTVGKRATLWMHDFLIDLERLERELDRLPFLGVKGTTGTQASFLDLFDGDHEKVRELDRRVTAAMGFAAPIAVSGQTYTRKVDYYVLAVLSGAAQSAHKMATDIRLLMHRREIEEPFESKQIGSSAMAYKRNPMRCERICSLARFTMSLVDNAAHTHANQWFERTLDDSANRRLSLPQAFLSLDGVLRICANVLDGVQVWPRVIRRFVDEELPFMATENILMAAVKRGGNRQTLHEAIRVHSMEASRQVKEFGRPNDLLARIHSDPLFANVRDSLQNVLDPVHYTGRASQQVDEFISLVVDPVLDSRLGDLQSDMATELSV